MKHFLIRVLPLLLVVLLGLVLPISSVLADEGDYTCTYDFTLGDELGWFATGWEELAPTYGGGSFEAGGFVSEHIPDYSTLYISKVFDAPVTGVQSIEITAIFDNVNPVSSGISGALLLSSGSTETVDVATETWLLDDATSGDQVFPFYPNPDASIGRVSFRQRMLDFEYDEFHIEKVVVTGNGTIPDAANCEGGGGGSGTLTRPLTSDDEADSNPLYDQVGIFNNPVSRELFPVLNNGGKETVSAWSKSPGALVHAADSGTIAKVKDLSWDDCGIAYASPTSVEDDTPVYVPFGNAQDQPCLVGRWADLETPLVFDTYWLDVSDVSIVTLQMADTKIQYLVRNARNYVVEGDSVEVGCVLGETIPLTTIPTQATNFAGLGAISGVVSAFTGGSASMIFGAIGAVSALIDTFFPPAPPASISLGYMTMSMYDVDDSIQELASQLTVEPTNDDHCAGTGAFANCLADNPRFLNNGDGWIAEGNVKWTEPGVVLGPGQKIYRQQNALSESDYTVTVFAQGENGAASQLRIFLGSHTQTYPAPIEWTSLQLATEPVGEPDAGVFYTVGIENTGSAPIEVASLCMTNGAPDTGPNSCYFNNQSFVEGISGWTTSEGVEPVDQGLNVPDNGTISQNVMLNPLSGGPATYKLVVRGNWWYTGALDTVSSASAIASVKYEYPDGTGYQDMVPINITGNLAYGAGQLAYIAMIEVSSPTDDLMNIKVETTDAGDMGVQGIQITDACLSTVDGGPFPGQGGDGAPPPIDANCTYVSRPQNNDPAAWLNWHWAKSEQFFTCKLMVLLNKMYVLGQQSYTLMGWQARYAQSTMKMWSAWLGNQMFPWLAGNFRNMAIGQVTTVYESGGSCNDIFCVLNSLITGILTPINNIVNTLLGIINTAANLFLTVLTGIIGLGLAFLIRLLNLFNQVVSLLTGIISAYSTATPATIDGLPICNIDPTSSPFCRATWVLDNTIFGGRWAVLLILVLGIASIHLVLWVIGEFKSAIVNTGSSS